MKPFTDIASHKLVASIERGDKATHR